MNDVKSRVAVIQEFANKHKLVFEDEGECGMGRECVGLIRNNSWVSFNPIDSVNYDYIDGFYSDKFYDISPEDAYHKHDCLAVLGRGEKAINQLAEWVEKLNELNVTVESYATGATGFQAMLSGVTGLAVKLPS